MYPYDFRLTEKEVGSFLLSSRSVGMVEGVLQCVLLCYRKPTSATCPSQTPIQVGGICGLCMENGDGSCCCERDIKVHVRKSESASVM